MTYKQLKSPNLDPVIYQPDGKGGTYALTRWDGWCLAYVQTAFGTGWAGYSAWNAWQNTEKKHTNRSFPKNVYFPVWFEHWGTYGTPPRYDNWGHVAVCKVNDNGSLTIWSSPASAKPYADTYSSIEQIERVYNSKYVGWSEDIARVNVIEPAQGGADDDMTIIIRPISMLKVHLKRPLQMYNIETGQPLWNSGDYMEVTGKTNIVRGTSFLIPVDRMIANEPFGFLEHEVMDPKNQIHDTQFDPEPFDDLQALSIYYRATGHPQAEEVSQNHVAAGTTFEAVMQTDMAWYKEKVRLLDEVLKKDVPPKLTEQDQKDLDLGRKFRAISKEANAKS